MFEETKTNIINFGLKEIGFDLIVLNLLTLFVWVSVNTRTHFFKINCKDNDLRLVQG